MPPRPADRERWLALGLLLAALALAYGVLVHPWWTVPVLEVEDRIDALQQRELRQRMQLQQAPQVQQRLVELQARQGQDAGFLPESNPELATAALIQRLESVVRMASPGNRSCEITNRSPLQAASRERFVRVTVQVRMRCGNAELASVLHALEGGAPRVFVDNLNVLVQRLYFAPGTGAPRSDGGLDVSFDLYGYLRPGAAGVADAD